MLGADDFCPFTVADLLRSEPTSANAATPSRRRGLCDSWEWLLIGAPSSHEFTVALRTLSLNHRAHTRKLSFALLRVNLQSGEYESHRS